MSESGRRPIVLSLVALAIALLAVGAWWLWGREANGSREDTQGSVSERPLSRDEALEVKRERRRDSAELAQPAKIGGRVTRASDGAGVPGAAVLVSRKGILQGQAPAPGEPTQPSIAVTDANGGWLLEGVEPGGYLLSASAAGYLPGSRTDVRVASGVDQLNLDLVVREGGHELSGRVSDIGGGAIEGVLVRVSDTSELDLGFGRAPLAALTDEDGRYRLHVANGRYSLTTWHADYVSATRLTEVRDGPRVQDFELVPGGVIEGIVRSRPSGDPVPNARVSFSDSGNGGDFSTNLSPDGSVVISDAEGRFVLRGMRSGVVELMARAEGWASPGPVEVALGIGEQVSDVELWVEPAFTIAGFVVPRGQPDGALEGVLVGGWSISPPGLLVANAPSASDGYFEIVGVRPGTWQVGAIGEDHLPSPIGATAVVKDQDVRDLIIELDTGVRIRGRVDPPQPARISLKFDPGQASLGTIFNVITDALASGRSDDAGVFEVGPVTPGGAFSERTLTLVAEADSGDRGEIEIQLGREDLEGVVIPLSPRASVAGTVLDDLGVPQRDVLVSIEPVERQKAQGGVSINGGLGQGGSPTGEDGRFVVRGLDIGEHRVVVEDRRGRALDWVEGQNPEGVDAPLSLTIEDTVNTTFLDLRVVPRDGVIEGVVLDAEGLPVADAWVTASLDDGLESLGRARRKPERDQPETIEGVVPEKDEDEQRDWSRSAFFAEPPVLTDENGLFVIKDLRRGKTYQVVAEGDRGGARAVQEEVAPGSRVTLQLEALTGIEGVVRSRGKPVTSYRLSLSGPVDRQLEVWDAEGRFSIERLDPGSYELSAKADQGFADTEVELASGKRERVELELGGWAVLEGELVASVTGEPMAGIAAMVIQEGAFDAGVGLGLLMGQGPKTDAKGRFRIDRVAPGEGSLVFVDRDASLNGGGEVASVSFEVEGGETLDLGTIRGLPKSDIPIDERGQLQMTTRVARFADRPRPPGTDLDEEPKPDPDTEPGPNRLWVLSVVAGGVAQAADIAPGDELITIDGQSVATLGAETAQELLSPARVRVGQSLRIELARGDQRFDVTLEAVAPEPRPD